VRILKRLFSPGVGLGLLALVVATSGAAMALPGHNSVRSDDIVNGQVRTSDIKDGTIKAADVHKGTFQRAPRHHAFTVYEDETTKTDATIGTTMGATYTWVGDLHGNAAMTGPSKGSSYGNCVQTDGVGAQGLCTLTLKLAGGQLTATGMLFDSAACTQCIGPIAVVGGTGDFAGATGILTSSCDFAVVPSECTYGYKFTTP